MDRNLSPRLFDPTKPLVARRTMTVDGGIELHPGDEIQVGEGEGKIPAGNALRLWMCTWLVYKEQFHPTPVEGDVPVEAVVVDAEALEAAVQAWLAENGELTCEVHHTGGGYFSVTPSWDAEPITKIKGKDDAQAKADELIAAKRAAIAEALGTEMAQGTTPADPQPETQDATETAAEPTPEQREMATNDRLDVAVREETAGEAVVTEAAAVSDVEGSLADNLAEVNALAQDQAAEAAAFEAAKAAETDGANAEE